MQAPLPYSDLVFAAAMAHSADPVFWLVGLVTVFVIAFSKGGFGGGAASVGVPMLSLVIDPIGAAIIVAPLVSFMDMFTLRSFGPSTWSKPDLKVLLPGLMIGLAVGFLVFERVDPRFVALLIGVISIGFAAHWFWQRRKDELFPPIEARPLTGLAAGAASGFTTFVAHAGGPPVAMYLIARRLDKRLFVGTNTAFFTIGNMLKLGPYGVLMASRPDCLAIALMLAPIAPLGVWLGVRVHHRLSEDAIFLATNAILLVGGARIVWQAVASLLQ